MFLLFGGWMASLRPSQVTENEQLLVSQALSCAIKVLLLVVKIFAYDTTCFSTLKNISESNLIPQNIKIRGNEVILALNIVQVINIYIYMFLHAA